MSEQEFFFSRLDSLLEEAALESGLPDRSTRGFDGGSWRWIWSQPRGEVCLELELNLEPESEDQGAWVRLMARLCRRDTWASTWRRSFWGRYLESDTLIDSALKAELTSALARAWHEAGLRAESGRT